LDQNSSEGLMLHLLPTLDFAGPSQVVHYLVHRQINHPMRVGIVSIRQAKKNLVAEFKRLGVQVWNLNQRSFIDFRPYLSLVRIVEDNDVSILHSHGLRPYIFAALLANRVPTVATVHIHLLEDFIINYGWARTAVALPLVRWALKRHILIGVVSNDARSGVIEIGIPPEKMLVVPNGVERAEIIRGEDGEQPLPLQQLGSMAHEFVFGFVGALIPRKGVEYLIQAGRRLAAWESHWKLWIVGDGPSMPRLERLATELGLNNNVKFFGQRSDARALMRAMDALILPSLTEGLPLVVLEALSMKLPVIATKVGGTPEVLANGAGLLVAPRDVDELALAMQRLIRNPELVQRLGQRGYERYTRLYTSEIMASNYKEMYAKARKKWREYGT
jgi:glycosyltransferase involved in cell wall biosynthesis